MEAKELFLKILDQQPTSKLYMQGLSGVYGYMEMNTEKEVLDALIAEGGSYANFPTRLRARQSELARQTQGTKRGEEAAPVPVEPAQLVLRVDEFIDANHNPARQYAEFCLQ